MTPRRRHDGVALPGQRPTGEPRATVVVVDYELSPRQLRHIERATSAAAILDRTGVIIEIFDAIHMVHVISEFYEGDGVHYRVRAPEAAIERIRAMLR